MTQLPNPPSPGAGATSDDMVAWVREHLGDLAREGADGVRPGAMRGGQVAADAALAGLDIAGYARTRSTVLPESRRGATRMSPYVRHGLLTLSEMWEAVAGAPAFDLKKYRDELLWQEYGRHLYARIGSDLGPVGAPRAATPDAVGGAVARRHGLQRLRRPLADRGRLAGQPDPDVAGLAVVRARRRRLAGR